MTAIRLQPLSHPVYYALELTPWCNHRCPGCGNVFVADKPARQLKAGAFSFLRLDAWRRVLDCIAPHVHSLRLTGGEPTLHPDFESILRYVNELGLSFTLFTNASWRNPDRIIDFLSTLPRLRGLLISLHGASASSHEVFTGVAGSFDRALANIHRATDAGLRVTLSTVLTCANKDELPEIAQIAQDVKASVAFARYIGPHLPALSLSKQEIIQAVNSIDQMRSAGKEVKFGSCIPQCLVANSSSGCYAGVAYCTIDPWGNLRPCNHTGLVAGNLLKSPLQEIWLGEAMQQFRQVIAQPCENCPDFALCHGGCRAMLFELGADPLITPRTHPPRPQPAPPVKLHPDWRPLLLASRHSETWGIVLLKGNNLLPVTHDAEKILDVLDAALTLRDICDRFGASALSLVGALAQKRLVTFLA